MTDLHWLPDDCNWQARLKALRCGSFASRSDAWMEAMALANLRADFTRTNALDRAIQAIFADGKPPDLAAKSIRLALLGSCTMGHLHGAIRVAGVRRGIWIEIYENEYGQYLQELVDTSSGLHKFNPNTVLLALDAHHLAAGSSELFEQGDADAAVDERIDRIADCWRLAREAFNCPVVHQPALPVHPNLLGLNEHRAPNSAARMIAALNQRLRPVADAAGVALLSVDVRVIQDGIGAWHDAGLWHRAKQEIAPGAAPFYGDMVGRLLAAQQGRSAKCLVLDLDNTLWGGVIGDDGMDGIILGQGSPLGEAYTAFQRFVRDLSRCGVILAVCSKNDEMNAVEPFEKHPEMTLRRQDIASFHANWADKATNIKAIAAEINIGVDSLVFIDDNPVERALVRQELPMVAVPEVSDDPIDFIRALSDAGYFEATAITDEDRARTSQYQGRRAREVLKATTDMDTYLRGLQMTLSWRRFDKLGLQRAVQLINKTNQFNLTTRRYTEADVLAIMASETSFGLQLRLVDRFGDNGVIAICIGKLQESGDLVIDTWLMSCRVLGRQVEQATLNLIASQAKILGAKRLLGDYIPTKKNMMVANHYENLGFFPAVAHGDGSKRAILDLETYSFPATFIAVTEG